MRGVTQRIDGGMWGEVEVGTFLGWMECGEADPDGHTHTSQLSHMEGRP